MKKSELSEAHAWNERYAADLERFGHADAATHLRNCYKRLEAQTAAEQQAFMARHEVCETKAGCES